MALPGQIRLALDADADETLDEVALQDQIDEDGRDAHQRRGGEDQADGLHHALDDARHCRARWEALAERAYLLGLEV